VSSLSGKAALVTGGANGIGAAICRCLAEKGARVAVADTDLDRAREMAEELSGSGLRAAAFTHDVTSWDSGRQVVEDVEGELGEIEILVNNAGVSRFVEFLEIDEEEWDRVLDVNLKGVFLTSRAALPGMVRRGCGRIVNISSVCGKLGIANFSHYCASKFGVIGLTQAIAAEVATHGITVNAVCPGIVDTGLKDTLVREMTRREGGSITEEEARAQFIAGIPLGRAQSPQDVAEMVTFLVSDHGRNLTGGSYHVDGGIAPR
jgi:meso-butanediol dehydrogenase / (S,S)-butanediol dehydrogenase / diacetyl reductase